MTLPRIFQSGFWADITITKSITLIAALPLALALALAVVMTVDLSGKARELEDVDRLVSLVGELSNLVHEQQKERGATAIYLTSKGQNFSDQVATQRQETDLKHKHLTQFLGGFDRSKYSTELDQRLDSITKGLARMADIRSKVDALRISTGDAIRYYTGLNAEMLSMIGLVSKLSSSSEVTVATLALENFLQGKERAGIERAVGSSGFATGQFDSARMNRFRTLLDEQRIYYTGFRAGANPAQINSFDAVMSSDPAQQVQALRDLALNAGVGGDLQGHTAAEFFDAQTQKINLLKALEQELIGDLTTLMTTLRSHAVSTQYSIIAGLTLAMLLAVAMAVFFARLIRNGIFRVVDAAAGMAQGNLQTEMPAPTHNELGAISRALELFRKTILKNQQIEAQLREKEAADAAQKIEAERQLAEAKATTQMKRQLELDQKLAREQQAANELSLVVDACAKGMFTQRLSVADKEGIFIHLAEGVNQIGTVADTGLRNIQAALDALSEGDLTYQMEGEYFGAFEDIRKTVSETLNSLSDQICRIDDGSQTIGGISHEISEAAGDLSRRTEMNAATLEQTASAIEQLAISVNASANSAKTASTAVAGILDETQRGNEVVTSAINAMQQIETSSRSIGKINNVIESIAFQTNLLALNAGVEAARAGEAGRGFAVVASEVRNLALRSSDAAKEIGTLITTSEQRVDEGVALVDQTGSVLQAIFDAVRTVSERVEEIAVSADKQSSSITEINAATSQLDQSTQMNAAMFEQTTATSLALKSEVDALQQIVSAFKTRKDPDAFIPTKAEDPPRLRA